MELPEKLKLIRSLKGWTQETVAEKLSISTHAYAKIERGETDPHYSRLQQIAEVMGIDLSQLFGLDGKNILNLNENGDNNTLCQNVKPSIGQTELQQELEKAQLMIEQQQKEIDYLKQQVSDLREKVSDLREIIGLLKKAEKPEE